jgi:hypothetical protein
LVYDFSQENIDAICSMRSNNPRIPHLSKVAGVFKDGMTNKFLEQHSYAISSEEKKKMEAVITIYKTIHAESEDESVDLEIILQSIKEPMLVIDDYYQSILERIGGSTQ